MYSGLKSKGATRDDWECDITTGQANMCRMGRRAGRRPQYSKYKMGNLHADVLFNVLNLWRI